MFDIIPDIHGQYDKLVFALKRLGYHCRNGTWRHADPARRCLFLGDFIDRGPHNGKVIRLVRRMLEAGTALAIMGNHELNAIHFHTNHPQTGKPLRPHSAKNMRQHQRFLDEFPVNAPETAEVIHWMRRLPLFLELDGFRAVHACWDNGRIDALRQVSPKGVLSADQLIHAADPQNPLFDLVETTTKGPDVALPDGHSFTDKDGTIRRDVRIKWWNAQGACWADVAMSVPDPSVLPDSPLPPQVTAMAYPATDKPVFFGHYWLTGTPVLQAPNALCLDYSAGRDGPLTTYLHAPDTPLSLSRISQFS